MLAQMQRLPALQKLIGKNLFRRLETKPQGLFAQSLDERQIGVVHQERHSEVAFPQVVVKNMIEVAVRVPDGLQTEAGGLKLIGSLQGGSAFYRGVNHHKFACGMVNNQIDVVGERAARESFYAQMHVCNVSKNDACGRRHSEAMPGGEV